MPDPAPSTRVLPLNAREMWALMRHGFTADQVREMLPSPAEARAALEARYREPLDAPVRSILWSPTGQDIAHHRDDIQSEYHPGPALCIVTLGATCEHGWAFLPINGSPRGGDR